MRGPSTEVHRTVAVLGLGAMGSRIARRLVAAGHDVVVWNRTRARAAELVRAGGRVADTPAEAAAESEVVLTVVSDRAALEEVCLGTAGVLAGLRPGSVLVEMSTVGPGAVHAVGALLPPGVVLVDAPVLGSVAEAEAGELTIFVGATERGLALATPTLAELGTVVPVGRPGAGAAAKLVANAALFGCIALFGETLALSRALGLADDVGFDVLALTPLAAQAARRRPAIEADEFPPRFRLRLATKDAWLMLSEAQGGSRLPVLEAAASWLHTAEESEADEVDYSAVLRQILHGRESES